MKYFAQYYRYSDMPVLGFDRFLVEADDNAGILELDGRLSFFNMFNAALDANKSPSRNYPALRIMRKESIASGSNIVPITAIMFI